MYFKPEEVTYERLLDEFFAKVDPTTLNRQGNDMGTQYRSVSCLAVAARVRPQQCSSCAERFWILSVRPCVLLVSIRFSMLPAAHMVSQDILHLFLVAQPEAKLNLAHSGLSGPLA